MSLKNKLVIGSTLALAGFMLWFCTPKADWNKLPEPAPLTSPAPHKELDQFNINSTLANATVMITNMAETGGGTGVILESSPTVSFVLTNNHVCQIFEGGGKVINDAGQSFPVIEYKQSLVHDLCVVAIPGNLHVNTPIAPFAPMVYEQVTVSGHPSLLPTIITRGHFSKKRIVEVMVGVRPCTEEDLKGGDALLCFFAGGIPILRTYEAQVVSATIMPGSSGSAVYNEKGELSGLVFAGAGQLGYGLIVPYEFVRYFLFSELSSLQPKRPLYTQIIGSEKKRKNSTQEVCKKTKNTKIKIYCDLLRRNLMLE